MREGGGAAEVSAFCIHGDVANDDDYNGVAEDTAEGARMAEVLGDKRVLFLAHHGVVVVGAAVVQAFDDLYYLERACEVQVLAMWTGRPLKRVGANLAGSVFSSWRGNRGEARMGARKPTVSKPMAAPRHVAVVGCGFTGTSALHQLVETYPVRAVTIFEKTGDFGPGYPYRTSEAPDYLINNTADTMGIVPEDRRAFLRWLEGRPDLAPNPEPPTANRPACACSTVSPRLLGKYLG